MSSSRTASSSSIPSLTLPLPKTFRAVVIPAAGADFKIETRPIPTLEDGEVLVEVLACGLCHSDSFTKNGVSWGSYPRVPGHEVIGLVAAMGPNAKRYKLGDRVGRGWHGNHCFVCNPCLHGSFNNCTLQSVSGITTDGGYAEYMVAPWQSLALVPEELSSEEAGPLMCAGVTVFNSIRNQRDVQAGSLVAIQGIGGLGHLAVQFAANMGFKVAAISSSSSKRELALKLGAHIYLDASTQDVNAELLKLGGARLIVSTVAENSKAQSDLVGGLGLDGTLLILGASFTPFTCAPFALIGKRNRIQGWSSGSSMDSEETMQFAAFKNVKTYVEVVGLNQVKEAYERMMRNQARFRIVMNPKL